MGVTRLDYCQYLLVSQTNYTLTNFAAHSEQFSHDAVNRYLRNEKLSPKLVWDNVKEQIIMSEQGYVAFDDTVIDKQDAFAIELVRRQWSGNAGSVIKGIGVVTCIYINPEVDRFWLLDYRLYDPQGDGKSKLDHVQEMLTNIVYSKQLPFRAVLMDSWYATKNMMLHIETLHKIYYCPLKSNRLVDDSDAALPYCRVDALSWNETELRQGKLVKLRGFPKHHKMQLFRVTVSSHRTDYVVTNDNAQLTTQAVRDVCALRWKIEQLHREVKQLTGLEHCQCRKARIQRNHIACAFLVWVRLNDLAHLTKQTLYQLKYGLLSDYLIQQLKNPSLKMVLA